jgi:hypothetical protein
VCNHQTLGANNAEIPVDAGADGVKVEIERLTLPDHLPRECVVLDPLRRVSSAARCGPLRTGPRRNMGNTFNLSELGCCPAEGYWPSAANATATQPTPRRLTTGN